MVYPDDDLSALDGSGFKPTQKRVSARVIEDLRAEICSGNPFWTNAIYANDPIEVSPSGAIKDGHHRLAAALLEGFSLDSLPPGAVDVVPEESILFPSRFWGVVVVDP